MIPEAIDRGCEEDRSPELTDMDDSKRRRTQPPLSSSPSPTSLTPVKSNDIHPSIDVSPLPGAMRFWRRIHQLPKEVAASLYAAGVQDEERYLNTPSAMIQSHGISAQDETKVRQRLMSQLTAVPLNGFDVLIAMTKRTLMNSTGIPDLDEVLNGGLRTGEIVEVIGTSGAGKTQLCLNVTASIVEQNANARVLYIDTTSSVDPNRLESILSSANQDHTAIARQLDRVFVQVATDWTIVVRILESLQSLQSLPKEERDGFFGDAAKFCRVVVIDSIAAILAPVLSRNHSQGHAIISYVGQLLQSLAMERNISILVTNYAYGDTSGISKPALGSSWSHVPAIRLHVMKDSAISGDHDNSFYRQIRIVKSNRTQTGDKVTFKLL